MIMKNLLCLLPALVAGVTAAPYDKREIDLNQTLSAFGTGIHGLPLYSDANGYAVIAGNGSDTSNLSPLVWTIDSTGESAWNVSINATSDASFFIVPSGDGYVRAGFTVNGSTPDGGATMGFVMYGADAMFHSGNTYLSQFWAQPVSTGTWNLVWNTDGMSSDGVVPVMLKEDSPKDD